MRIKVNNSQWKRLVRDIEDVPETTIKRATQFFRDVTPRDTGNARSKTVRKGDTIHANYPYADRLDKGYSKQAPRGMTEPTLKFIEDEIARQLRSI